MSGAWFRLPSGQLFHAAGHRPVAPSRSVPVAEADALAELLGLTPVVELDVEQSVNATEGGPAVASEVAVTEDAAQLEQGGAVERGDAATVDEAGA